MMHPPAAPTRLRIDFAQASDPGRDPNKQVNEDSCGYAETKFGHLCVLCDGMGGHYGGKEASRTAITTIFEIVEQTPPTVGPSAALKAAIEEAGRRVYRLGGPPENRTRPGSTVVAMVLHDHGVDVAHVGDSRAFVIRANQIYPLTRDHSMVQGMIDAGMLTESQAIGHPDANKITRALGMKPEVEVEVRPESMELYPGDVLLMSSDGLTDLVLSTDILGCTRQALASGSVEHACKMLVQLANDRGGYDNVTVQMARVVEAGARSPTLVQGPPGTASRTGTDETPSMGAPQDTIGMTRPDDAALSQRSAGHAGHAPPGPVPYPFAVPPQAPSPTATWGPVPPTPTDAGLGISPTPIDVPGAAHISGAAHAPGAAPQMAANLQAGGRPHIADPSTEVAQGGSALSLGSTGVPGLRVEHSPNGPQPAQLAPPRPTSPSYTAEQGAAPTYDGSPGLYGPTSMPTVSTIARPSRSGIVFVILGLSTVIAVLLVLVLWSLLPR